MRIKYLFDQPSLHVRKLKWLKFLCEFYFEIKHVKGLKENKLVGAFGRKFHVEAIGVCKFQLRERVVDALDEYENYLGLKEGLQQDELDNKYEGYHLEQYNPFLVKTNYMSQGVHI